MSDEQSTCPRCGTPYSRDSIDPNDPYVEWKCGRQKPVPTDHRPGSFEMCDYAASLRRERDEARALLAEADVRNAPLIVQAEQMRRVVEAVIAWAEGIPAYNWRVVESKHGIVSVPPETERWNVMVRAVDEYRKEQQDD